MTNIPWRASIFQRLRDGIRFVLWFSLAVNCGIVAFYSVLFTYQFCRFGWTWAKNALFGEPW